MNREEYKNNNDQPVNFFTGIEVEKSPANGLHTLFVVGDPDIEYIARLLTQHTGPEITHIYFGANQSFHPSTFEELDDEWVPTIIHFLTLGYWCTLDFDHSLTSLVQESSLFQYMQFIPMISVKFPDIRHLGYNATLKLDDADFKFSNHGVWCHSLNELQSREAFTSWSEYNDDEIIEDRIKE